MLNLRWFVGGVKIRVEMRESAAKLMKKHCHGLNISHCRDCADKAKRR